MPRINEMTLLLIPP